MPCLGFEQRHVLSNHSKLVTISFVLSGDGLWLFVTFHFFLVWPWVCWDFLVMFCRTDVCFRGRPCWHGERVCEARCQTTVRCNGFLRESVFEVPQREGLVPVVSRVAALTSMRGWWSARREPRSYRIWAVMVFRVSTGRVPEMFP